ncbi:hypothetical protein [Methylobacter sp. BlB1]|uniref:hypothetical protein n=1 Tax=Methylobacter sp. BlB1 TaxID=2785914 RepID=UPI0018934D69|nr:hypothetical protein [Methylobacter sp. BlB1]MBF6650032.1 hypothetical protein [Methylobacter sp. BlB1]
MSKQQEKKHPYKPEGLNRILWIVAKNIAIPHPDFGHKDNALFAISQYSGAKFESIHMHIIVDSVIDALGEYYEHSGISRYELRELLKTFRTDYAALTNQKWTQDIASEKIIDACMTRMALARVKDGDTVLIDLSGPEVSFEEAWKKADEYEKSIFQKILEDEDKIHEKCRNNGEFTKRLIVKPFGYV